MKLSNSIIKPILSEKSMALTKANKYMFEVVLRAQKGKIDERNKKNYFLGKAKWNEK